MYTDIPDWSDYLYWWGCTALVLLGIAGAVGGLLYLVSLIW